MLGSEVILRAVRKLTRETMAIVRKSMFVTLVLGRKN